MRLVFVHKDTKDSHFPARMAPTFESPSIILPSVQLNLFVKLPVWINKCLEFRKSPDRQRMLKPDTNCTFVPLNYQYAKAQKTALEVNNLACY